MFRFFKFLIQKTLVVIFCFIYGCNAVNIHKISPEVQQQLNQGKTPNVIVDCPTFQSVETTILVENLSERIRETSQNPLTSRSIVMTNLVNEYENVILVFMAPAIQELNFLNVPFEVFWVTSQLFVPNATESVISQLARIQIVSTIFADSIMLQIQPEPQASQPQATTPWNIDLIDARCKNITCLGGGIIIGIMDTGALTTHIEIKDNWIGGEFGYLDGYGESCTSSDDDGHGTHVTATACGKTVGVAPNAKWMMCRNCRPTGCTYASALTCGQWLLCPYKCGKKNTKDCTKRPHVINNSWGGDYSGTNSTSYYFFYEMVQKWNMMGIISIFASGNAGPTCFTTGYPAGYDIVFDVGAVDDQVTVAKFSSIGPAISARPVSDESIASKTCTTKSCGGTSCTLTKPIVVAPGVNIRSAWNTGNDIYETISGTSMATPHVTGVVALMLCANTKLKQKNKKVHDILKQTTDKSRIDLLGKKQNRNNVLVVQTNLMCNFFVSKNCDDFPNNLYGFGLVDACKAVIASKEVTI